MTGREAGERIAAEAEAAVARHAETENDPEKLMAYSIEIAEWASEALERIIAILEAAAAASTVH